MNKNGLDPFGCKPFNKDLFMKPKATNERNKDINEANTKKAASRDVHAINSNVTNTFARGLEKIQNVIEEGKIAEREQREKDRKTNLLLMEAIHELIRVKEIKDKSIIDCTAYDDSMNSQLPINPVAVNPHSSTWKEINKESTKEKKTNKMYMKILLRTLRKTLKLLMLPMLTKMIEIKRMIHRVLLNMEKSGKLDKNENLKLNCEAATKLLIDDFTDKDMGFSRSKWKQIDIESIFTGKRKSLTQ